MSDHVVFEFDDVQYAVPADAVVEVAGFPRLTPVPEAPPHVIGAVDVRGELVPVADLGLLTRASASSRRITDVVVFVNGPRGVVGLVAHAVLDVADLTDEARPATGARENALVRATAAREDAVVHVLDVDAVVARVASGELARRWDATEWTEAESRVLHERRTRLLARPDAMAPDEDGRRVAIIGLDGERFGVDLDSVREFTSVKGLAPIPCCPPHVLGCLNLRGDVLVLVDLRPVLGMTVGHVRDSSKVMVVDRDDGRVGVLVDDVHDVTTLDPATVMRPPAASRHEREEYLKGTAPYGGGIMTLLDLDRILTSDWLSVKEEV